MLAKVYSFGLSGLEAYPVTIEVDAREGLPGTTLVGLPDNAVRESRERVRSAIKNSGYAYEPLRITVNLSPAHIKKEGPSFDLALALGILAATGQIDSQLLNGFAILGELSLDGRIRPVHGTLSIAMRAATPRFAGILLPKANAAEAALIPDLAVYPVTTLNEVVQFLSEPQSIPAFQAAPAHLNAPDSNTVDFSDVKGQAALKRGLEVAAAGSHNVLMIGPPGSGKSFVSKRLPTILPDMALKEALETTKIYSVMGLLKGNGGLIGQRPFRSPHHTTSDIAMVGGGSNPKPGEITLAHNGVLFMDEFPEFSRSCLEVLRQPLEDHDVTVARTNRTVTFPARFMLVAAMNPCPCGHFTNPLKACHCTPPQIQRYLSKISGPLLDRIDIHLEVPALPPTEMLKSSPAEASLYIKKRTVQARQIQIDRLRGTSTPTNAQMNPRQVKQFCTLSKDCQDLLKTAIEELELSARAHDKILKVSRTIADLEGKKEIRPDHIAEAIQYRCLDRGWWG